MPWQFRKTRTVRQFRHEVSMVCPGNMPIFVATLTPLAPLVFQTAGMKCISGCKVWTWASWQKTKFLSSFPLLLFWLLQNQPSVLALLLNFDSVFIGSWLRKMSSQCNDITTQKNAKDCLQRDEFCWGVTSALQGRMTQRMGRKILEWSFVISGVFLTFMFNSIGCPARLRVSITTTQMN